MNLNIRFKFLMSKAYIIETQCFTRMENFLNMHPVASFNPHLTCVSVCPGTHFFIIAQSSPENQITLWKQKWQKNFVWWSSSLNDSGVRTFIWLLKSYMQYSKWNILAFCWSLKKNSTSVILYRQMGHNRNSDITIIS